ncbi:26S proteasome non-ATPase regulatory subunit 1-like [Paramuricea clavata]|uniref:26S proteasome non-ATPase regulatory subunit 1-like n=1 Tax=Paramuricea clavata TaxID=317549 RepID=A0A6S7J5K7_PARCT|nr:26S proteasome non-ATPase regulatory subunit 1-like [Paramuricea clavata]
MVRHGGCLGLGLAAMGTAREDIYNQLKDNLYHDDAVTGEAAGLSMGLVMLGSFSSTAIDDMVAYARETKHEKILRGLALGISLVMYSRMEEADALIDDLFRDKDPNLRICGMYTIAMAYCGTGNNKAIKQLLHVAVSDVNDDVRRAAVVSLGFLMFRTPEQCPSVVSLLSESYNPHVRYGAAIALGISCAGTGLKEAVSIVEPMTNDPVNYVRQVRRIVQPPPTLPSYNFCQFITLRNSDIFRKSMFTENNTCFCLQGALIASSLLLIQHNDHTNSKVSKFREIYSKVIADKHEDQMAKFGSIIAQGILDAGGRNVTISLQSRAGHTHMMSVVGLLVFTHYWYWFPLTHFISLAFTPTCLIGLNSDVKMPKMKFISNAKPSLFAYPEALKPPKKEEREKVTKAVLSYSSKAKKTKKDATEKEEPMDVDNTKSQKEKEKGNEKEKDEDSSVEKDKSEKKDADESKKETEPDTQMLDNPSRVMQAQLKLISLPKDSRYSPLKPVSVGGVIMMRNSRVDEPEELLEPLPAAKTPSMDDEEDEPEPPEPFEYVDED